MKPFYPISRLEKRKIQSFGHQNIPESYTHSSIPNHNYQPIPTNNQHFQYSGIVPKNSYFKGAQNKCLPLYTSIKYQPHFLTHIPFDDYQILSESGFNYFTEFQNQKSKDEHNTMKKSDYSASIDSNTSSNLKQNTSTSPGLDASSTSRLKSSISDLESIAPQDSEVATTSKLESSISSFVTVSKVCFVFCVESLLIIL